MYHTRKRKLSVTELFGWPAKVKHRAEVNVIEYDYIDKDDMALLYTLRPSRPNLESQLIP